MSAALKDVYTTKELEQRLERWADWARSPSMGSGGGSVGYMKERLDQSADSRELTDEVAVTERAVARAKMEDRAYWRVLAKYYLGRLSIIEIALHYHTSEAGMQRLLDSAKACVQGHLYDIEGRS